MFLHDNCLTAVMLPHGEDCGIACDATVKMMRSQDGMIPFYREVIGRTLIQDYLTDNFGLGAVIRKEFDLWNRCGETATDVSREILRRVWRRLG